MWNDPIVEEVRRVRDAHATLRAFNRHDLDTIRRSGARGRGEGRSPMRSPVCATVLAALIALFSFATLAADKAREPVREDASVGRHHPVPGCRRWDRGTRLPRLGGVGVDHQRGLIDRLEVAGGNGLQLVEQRVVPAVLGGAAEVPVRPVVGDDESVVLHGAKHDLRRGAEMGDVDVAAHPEPRPHWREGGVACRARLVPRRPQVAAIGSRGGDPDGVIDGAGGDLVGTQQAGKDGKPASAEVHVSGRSALERRSKTAPEPAVDPLDE